MHIETPEVISMSPNLSTSFDSASYPRYNSALARSGRTGDSFTQLNLLRWYFIFVALLTVKYAYLTAHTLNGWSIEDWLINYQAGFLRRGAVGAVVYDLHTVLEIRLVPIVLLAQVS